MPEKRFNLLNRLLHWSIAFTLLFLILTVLLRTGWMNKDSTAAIVQEQLKKNGVLLSREASVKIGKAVRKPMWQTHTYAGYVLVGLYVLRMLVHLLQGCAFKSPFAKDAGRRDRFKGWVYIVFYLMLACSLITGLMIVHGPKIWKDPMESIHVGSLYYLVTFIVLHLGGVLIADAGREKGLISKIITGDRPY